MMRTRALCASSGACTAPGSTPATTSRVDTRFESTVASCEPSPSLDAYHAIRSHAAAASPEGRTSAPDAYHAPGVTVTVRYIHFVESLVDVSNAAEPGLCSPGE